MTSALTLFPTLNQINANRGCSRAGDLISVRAHQSRASTRRLKGPNAMTTQSPPTVSPEAAREVSESDDAFMQLLMNPKYWGLPFKMIEEPEHIIEAYVVTDGNGRPFEDFPGPGANGSMGVYSDRNNALGLAGLNECGVRKAFMVIMPKAKGGASDGQG